MKGLMQKQVLNGECGRSERARREKLLAMGIGVELIKVRRVRISGV
jgi:hypothetical protein